MAFFASALACFAIAIPFPARAQESTAQESTKASSVRPDDAAEKRLQRLKDQADRNRGNQSFLYDYLQALEEAGRDEDMLALRSRLDISAPATVLGRLGRAASNLKQYPVAVELFEKALKKAPNRADVIAGLAYAYVDSNRAPDAQKLLEGKSKLLHDQVPMLDAYAEALRAQRKDTQALLAYERILEIDPGNREAARNRIFVAAELGAKHRALELAGKSPGLLSEEELATLRADRSIVTARWAGASDQNGPQRFAGVDVALTENEKLLGRASGATRQRLRFDRVVLLRERYRMKEAIALHREVASEYSDTPAYVKVAAADAYLYMREPERARDLYKAAIAQGDDSVNAQMGLFYAYNDAEQHKEALEQIDRILNRTPKKVRAYSPLTIADNPDYASAAATAGAARGYQDYDGNAQLRLESFRDEAPWNMEGREKLAALYGTRGWPRKAEQEYSWILAAEPRDRTARIGQADTLRELRDWRPAEKGALALEAEYPEDRQVQRVGRLWDIHEMRELRVEAGTGTSSGSAGPLGSHEHQIESWLYSAPYKYDWRAFLHQYEAAASFPAGNGSWHRLGAGAEYRIRDWRASAEVSSGYNGDTDVGVTLAGDWSMNDYWNFEAQAESSTNDIPLQGRASGVTGKALKVGATYRVSESRRFSASLQAIDFSDGNEREVLSAQAFQRLLTGPVFKLDGVLGLYTSRNSLDNAPYFNPESDFGADITLIAEQRLWRRYDRSFVHRLYLSAGTYEQKNFGSGPTWGIRYEHEWNFDDRLSLLYGLQRTLHPYDGQGEYANYYNLVLDWKF
ncbi:MAG TPA: poly-beta-1,6 N-acetyl-D-glucosamine export porin PgaA [Burkholderiales bacterium]|nr:poly-beta-1,6 N-acetyl-D-glucosamine export porin PgaA [Burkholderiales bacterium]